MPTSELSDTDKALVEVFCSRLSAAFDNVTLYEELERANQRLEEKVARRTAQLLAAKERLENQSERLKSANAFKSEVLGTVAHDLKNPLGVILGRTEMLNELLSADEAAGEGRARPDRAHPPVGAPPDGDGRGSDRRRAGRRGRHLGARLQPRFRAARLRGLGEQPQACRRQGAGAARGRRAGAPGRAATPRGCARRSTISSATPSNTARSAGASTFRAAREGRRGGGPRGGPGAGPFAGGQRAGSSAASSGFRPSRPAAKARPASASPSPNASSNFTTGASSWKVPVRREGRCSRSHCRSSMRRMRNEPAAEHLCRRRRGRRPRHDRRLPEDARLRRHPLRRRQIAARRGREDASPTSSCST